ncbi:hypothetical protein N7492_007525 [Penicillium capsulatum]|uniref:Uncharacterized protein n=1 Tax=Penicillium capsulatum TaxID=69766 RepID=A0A9W9I2A8_9EURO|nr:hypothetical protein N7492_007525 [Penicillium capsulatum]KAJ6117359.1 hypothetical protein N7512_007084 [Penicillium capsulatum]
MKFALSAALLASVAVALPTGSLPVSSSVVSSLSTAVPTGVPTSLPSGLPLDLPVPGPAGQADSMVMTVLDKAQKQIPVNFQNEKLANALSSKGLLGESASPVGQVIDTASSLPENPEQGIMAVKTNGQYMLVQVTSVVQPLLQEVFGTVSSLPVVGEVASVVESLLPIKRDALSGLNVQNAAGELIPVSLNDATLNKLTSLGDVESLKNGPLGTVVNTVKLNEVESVTKDLPANQVFTIVQNPGAVKEQVQVLVVQLESKASGVTGLVTGLLSSLGLGPVTETVGQVTGPATQALPVGV